MGTKTITVNLDNHFLDLVDECIKESRFANTSEVGRAGLRLLEENESELASLRTALAKGLASGSAAALHHGAFRARMRNEYNQCIKSSGTFILISELRPF